MTKRSPEIRPRFQRRSSRARRKPCSGQTAEPAQIPEGRKRRDRVRRGALARLGRRRDQYRRALSDHGQHGADRRRLRRCGQARGRDDQRGRRHQVAGRRQAQSDHLRRAERHHVTRTETDRLITSNKLSAIHGCFASAPDLIASESANAPRCDHYGIELRPAQQGPNLYVHAVRPRLAIRQGAVADVETR